MRGFTPRGRPWRSSRVSARARGAALVFALVPAIPCAGQSVPAGTAAPADWSITHLTSIRFGRVSLVHDPAGPRLDVYSLRAVAPPPPAPSTASELPEFDGDVLRVTDFRTGVRNRLGGFANVFQRLPSKGSVEPAIGPDERPGLHISCHNEPGGFCGGWVHSFDLSLPPAQRRYLDARALATLTFWVRGEAGDEDVLLKVADAVWEKREDALPVGPIGSYLASGRIEKEWQLARVPLSALPSRIDPASLAVLVFETRSPGDSDIWITAISFSRSPDSFMALPEPAPAASRDRPAKRATWVWHTRELVRDTEARDDLIAFLRDEGFDVVFLQLPDSSGGTRLPGEIVPDGAGLRPLISALHAAGVEVHALDGYKRYALPEYHEGVLRTIGHVARYNAAVPPGQRFDGFRHDIEPYILPGFDGPRREPLLSQFLEIVARSAERSHAAGLAYGVDIPFWFDSRDQDTGETARILFRGEARPVSEHVLDLADNVAIMDYRTSAWGADGTIRHAEGELEYAARAGKHVFVGLETAPLLDEELMEFRGAGVSDPEGLDFGNGAFVVGGAVADSIRIAFLAPEQFADSGRRPEMLRKAGIDPERALWWPISSRVPVPSERLSFAKRGPAELMHVMEETARGFAGSPAFAGFAIHEARTYRSLKKH